MAGYPIETALRDGTRILLYIKGRAIRQWEFGRWVDQETLEYGKTTRRVQEWRLEGAFFGLGDLRPGTLEKPGFEITHWLPAPDGPEEQVKRRGGEEDGA